MIRELFIVVVLGLNLTGCTMIHKHQTKLINPKPVEKPEEKVWIEAERKKVWVNAHVDDSGDMIEGHYKHVIMTPGHWVVKDGQK